MAKGNGIGALLLGLLALWFISKPKTYAEQTYPHLNVSLPHLIGTGTPIVNVIENPWPVSGDSETVLQETKTGLEPAFLYAKQQYVQEHKYKYKAGSPVPLPSEAVPSAPKTIGTGTPIVSKVGMDIHGTLAQAQADLKQALSRTR